MRVTAYPGSQGYDSRNFGADKLIIFLGPDEEFQSDYWRGHRRVVIARREAPAPDELVVNGVRYVRQEET